jgi:putative transposase
MGKRNNQAFVFLPHARFIYMVTCKAQPGEPATGVGKRVKRGVFLTATDRRFNADVNGAYNMIVKVVPDAFSNGRGGVVVHPVRLNLANQRLAS